MNSAPSLPQSLRIALFASALTVLLGISSLPAQTSQVPEKLAKTRASCELNSSGQFSLSLRGGSGNLSWILSTLTTQATESADPFWPPLALRAGIAFGPVYLGSILPPGILQNLKDPLDHSACALLDSKPAPGPSLDARELAASAKPGFQDAPGIALDAESSLPFPHSDDQAKLRFQAGLFPAEKQPIVGLRTLYSAHSAKASIEADIAALVDIEGRQAAEAEDSWYLDAPANLPENFPIALGRAGLGLVWGPLSFSAGLLASNSAAASFAFYGESGACLKIKGFSALAALAFPLSDGSPSGLPLIAIDGLASGRSEWAQAGIAKSWRWKSSWEGGPGLNIGASYEGSTGRPLARARDYSPRREKLEAETGIARQKSGFEAKASLSCSRVLDWKADGRSAAENKASIQASFGFDSMKKTRPSFTFQGGVGIVIAQARDAKPGAADTFLLLAPGAMTIISRGFSYKIESGARFKGVSARLSLSSEEAGKPCEFAFRAETALPESGRAYLEIGPGALVALGWKNH
jgi:hypothetical protein